MGKTVNKAELSEILGVSERSLTAWQDEEPPMPVQKRADVRGQSSEYDTAAVISWLRQRDLRVAGAESARDRLAVLQAEEIELRLAEKRGQLVQVDQVEPMWSAMVGAARSFLRSEVNRLAQLLNHIDSIEARRDLLSETFDEFLNKLAGYDPDNADSLALEDAG
ncbi:MAG: terminase small subunit [Leptothrix sp. (in: b-proteobacteria)]